MKSLRQILYLLMIALLLLFAGCDALGLADDPDDGNGNGDIIDDIVDDVDTYVDLLVDDFMAEFESRALSPAELDIMRIAIYAKITSAGLTDSSDLSALMPLVAASAQVSLATLGTDEEKIINIKKISAASVSVVGNIAIAGTTDTVLAEIVTSVSVAMVESISDTGIDATLISETTQATVSSIVGALGEVNMGDSAVLIAVANIARESAVAVAENVGVTSEILETTLSAIPASASAAVEEIPNFVISDADRQDLVTATFDAVVDSVGTLEADVSVIIDIDIAVVTVSILEITTSELLANTAFNSVSEGIADELVAAAIGALNDDQTILDELGAALVASVSIDITPSEFDTNVAVVEVEEEEEASGTTYSTADYEQIGYDLIQDGKFEGALGMYQVAMERGDSTPQAKIWWSILSLASISVDVNVIEVTDNLGIESYPRSFSEFLSGEANITTEIEVVETDDQGNPYTWEDENGIHEYTHLTTVFPFIENEDMFLEQFADGEDIMGAQMLAMIYNLQANYPDGFNRIVDSFIKATNKIDDVLDVLLEIPNNTSFSYTYDMFEDEPYVAGESDWPSYIAEDGDGTPLAAEITVGKAEVYIAASGLELIRAMLFMGQSVSVGLDLDGYWDIFNPIDGDFYLFDLDGDIDGFDEEFDWAMLSNPLSDGFIMAREDASFMLDDAKGYILSGLGHLKLASELVIERNDESPFFISPANEKISVDDWLDVLDVQAMATIYVDKLVDSITNGIVIYLPDFDALSGPQDLLDFYDPDAWPTAETSSGYGVNFSAFFDEPLLTVDSLFDITDDGEFVLYTFNNVDTYTVTTAYDETVTYYVKFNDVSLNGLAVGTNGLLGDVVPFNFTIQDDNSVFLALDSKVNVMVGSSLTTAGTTFTFDGQEFISTGSFFHMAAEELVGGLIGGGTGE